MNKQARKLIEEEQWLQEKEKADAGPSLIQRMNAERIAEAEADPEPEYETSPVEAQYPNYELNKHSREDLIDLIKWVGPLIRMRDANGKVTDRFCLLCGRGGYIKEGGRAKRVPCRHAEIWAFLE